MKTPKPVAAAKAAVEAKRAELEAARLVVDAIDKELMALHDAVRQAQIDADASLPQCRKVSINRYSGNEQSSSAMVVLRKTPTGILVVRNAGNANATPKKFKWDRYSGQYIISEKHTYGLVTLRDVPPEYMPNEDRNDD